MKFEHAMGQDRQELFDRITEKLGAAPVDYSTPMKVVEESRDEPTPTLAAGVMLILASQDVVTETSRWMDAMSFRLIKRSLSVSQAGDLACPGGILSPRIDSLLGRLISSGILPLLRSRAGDLARGRDPYAYHILSLFLATAARESWEEIGLNPFRFRYLGPLPPYALESRMRMIFPSVCMVFRQHPSHPNDEVESVVDIPLRLFFNDDRYACLMSPGSGLPEEAVVSQESKPCLVFADDQGNEQVLWGATFSIIMTFLSLCFDFEPPSPSTSVFYPKG